MTNPNHTPSPSTATAEQIIDGFFALAYSRTMVRLEWENYWTGDRESSLEGYRQDRNTIRRDTTALNRIVKRIGWFAKGSGKERFALALIEASGGSRLNFCQNGKWEYTTGQYQPVEIRGACVRLLERAERILKLG